MGDLQQLAYLLATDSAFREAFAASPHDAVSAREVVLTPIEVSAVFKRHSCLAASPQRLATLFDSHDYPENWGGIDASEVFMSCSTSKVPDVAQRERTPNPILLRGGMMVAMSSQQRPAPESQTSALAWMEGTGLSTVGLLIEQIFNEIGESRDYVADLRLAFQLTRPCGINRLSFTLLPLLCCSLVGAEAERASVVAAAWQLLALAAHLLDDLEDQSVHPFHKTSPLSQTLNVANGLIFAAQLALTKLPSATITPAMAYEISRDFQYASLQICAGQQLDLRQACPDLETAWRIVRAKAGEPFALACRTGVLAGGGNLQQVTQLGEFGYHLGILNQIGDDCAGVWDRRDEGDLRQGRRTLPMVYALSVADPPTRTELHALLKQAPSDPRARWQLRERITELGAVHYLMLTAEVHRQQAGNALQAARGDNLANQHLFALLNQTFPSSWTVDQDATVMLSWQMMDSAPREAKTSAGHAP